VKILEYKEMEPFFVAGEVRPPRVPRTALSYGIRSGIREPQETGPRRVVAHEQARQACG